MTFQKSLLGLYKILLQMTKLTFCHWVQVSWQSEEEDFEQVFFLNYV